MMIKMMKDFMIYFYVYYLTRKESGNISETVNMSQILTDRFDFNEIINNTANELDYYSIMSTDDYDAYFLKTTPLMINISLIIQRHVNEAIIGLVLVPLAVMVSLRFNLLNLLTERFSEVILQIIASLCIFMLPLIFTAFLISKLIVNFLENGTLDIILMFKIIVFLLIIRLYIKCCIEPHNGRMRQ